MPAENTQLSRSSPKPLTSWPSISPCENAASVLPQKNALSQRCLWRTRALTLKSKATPRRISPASIRVTGRYRLVRMMPCASGKATSRMPTPSTSQVSLASQNGPMAEIMVSRSASDVAPGSSMPTPRS